MLSGSLILVIAIALVAQCTKYWHFLLCQGFGVGVCTHFLIGRTIFKKLMQTLVAWRWNLFWARSSDSGTLVSQEAGTGVWDYSCRVLFGWNCLSYNCATVDRGRWVSRFPCIAYLLAPSLILC